MLEAWYLDVSSLHINAIWMLYIALIYTVLSYVWLTTGSKLMSYHYKIEIIFLIISLNMCFVCSKEPPH